jgi:hypothetical protein
MIHHVTIEADKRLIAKEREFWNILGFSRNLSIVKRNEPDWLYRPGTKQAIHLHWTGDPAVPEFGCLALVQTDFDRTVRILRSFGHEVDCDILDFWGHPRAYTACPTGHNVELLAGAPSIQAGMPREGTTP